MTLAIAALLVMAWATTSQAQEKPPVPAEALDALGAYVHGGVEKGYVVGSEFVVIRDGMVVFHEACGFSDRESDTEWQIGTLCNIRSMTKPVTGAALQILIDREQVGLDDPVANYLPGFDNDRSRAITVRQVLTHRSGLPLTILEAVDEYPDLLSQANAAGERGPEFAPGSKFWYSDIGTDVVGAIVEAMSGERLDLFVTREILEPLGMSDTFYGFDGDDPRFERIASLYVGAANAWTRFWTPDDDPFYPCAWGSQTLYSTPLDYAKFLSLWMDDGMVGDRRILSSEAVTRQLTAVSPMSMLGSDQRFPTEFRDLEVYYGQMSVLHVAEGRPEEGPVVIGHSGSDGTIAWAWPDRGLMVLYFTQSRGGTSVMRIERVIDTELLHPGEPLPTEDVPDAWRPLLGTYIANFASFELEPFTVMVRHGKLVLDIPSQMVFELLAPGADGRRAFALAPEQVSVEFVASEDGSIDLLRLHQAGTAFDLPREGTPLAAELAEEPVVTEEQMQTLVGEYDDPEAGRVVEILIDDGHLFIKAPPNLVLELRPTHDTDLWQVRASPAITLSFQRDDTGAVVSMSRHIADNTLVMPRRTGD